MPTTSKVLIPIIVVLTIAFWWQATAVLQTRQNWNTTIQKKASEIAKVKEEIDLYVRGDDDARQAFADFVKADIRPLASVEFGKVYDEKSKMLDPLASFTLAMDKFVDPKVIENYRQAVEKLNELQKSSVVEPTQLTPLMRDYDSAERELEQQLKNLDDAYARFLGETSTASGGIRGIAERKVEGVYRGLGVDTMRNTLVRVGEIVVQHRALYASMISDGAKNETVLRDLVAATSDRIAQTQRAADGAVKERDERQRELDEEKATHEREKVAKAEAEKTRDKWIADLAALQKQFDETQQKCIELFKLVRSKEVELDQQRGIKNVVLSPEGNGTGKVQSVDERSGTIRVNLGTKAGVRNGAHLHVYRTSPKAKYLGILEVIETDTDGANGQMLQEYRQVDVRVNDSVVTDISDIEKTEKR